jgi:hypothetical protein
MGLRRRRQHQSEKQGGWKPPEAQRFEKASRTTVETGGLASTRPFVSAVGTKSDRPALAALFGVPCSFGVGYARWAATVRPTPV